MVIAGRLVTCGKGVKAVCIVRHARLTAIGWRDTEVVLFVDHKVGKQ